MRWLARGSGWGRSAITWRRSPKVFALSAADSLVKFLLGEPTLREMIAQPGGDAVP